MKEEEFFTNMALDVQKIIALLEAQDKRITQLEIRNAKVDAYSKQPLPLQFPNLRKEV